MDEKQLKLIEQYLKDSGLNAAELLERMKAIKASTTEFNRELGNAQTHFSNINSTFSSLSQHFRKSAEELSKMNSLSSNINRSFKTLGGITDKLRLDSEGISKLTKTELESLEKKARVELSNLKARKEELALKSRSSALTKEEQDQYEELNKLIDANGQLTNEESNYIKQLLKLTRERKEEEEKINQKLGLAGKLVDGIVGSLGKLGIKSEFFEDLKENMAATAKEAGSTKWDVLKTGIKGIGDGLKAAFKDPITQITLLIKLFEFFKGAALKANTEIVTMGKSLGTGAEAYREKLVGIESSSSNINVTTANLVEAYGELVSATGLAYQFTEDQLVTQIKLTKQVGLQANEAANVQRMAVLNGKTSEETYKTYVKGLVAARNQYKVGIDFKSALAESLKVSDAISANLGNDPIRITKAVVAVKALGMSLDQVAKSGEDLLNWETSIEKELKAELLTGKELNLERARAAALQGDQVALAEELAKNVGTAKDFAKMNVLQQKALAESVGMTKEELASTLKKREEAIASGKSLQQITEEEATAAIERQNIQEQFNQGILKLQSLIGNLLAGPLGAMLDILVKIVNVVNLIIQPFTWLVSLIKQSTAASITFLGVLGAIYAIKNKGLIVEKATAGVMAIKNAFTSKAIAQEGLLGSIKSRGFFKTLAEAAMTAFKSVANIPFVGPILGAVAAAGAVALGMKFFSKGNDVISPGYGKRTIMAPEGAIALNDKDTVIAGTNLGGGKKEKPSFLDTINPFKAVKKLLGGEEEAPPPQIDLTPLIAAINQVKASVDKLYDKDTSVNMNGTKLNNELKKSKPKVA